MHPGLGLLAIGGCWRKLHSATAGYSLKKILKQPTPSSKETFIQRFSLVIDQQVKAQQ
jgi:hypothetical protein